MKKVLLASTALFAMSGAAFAEMKVTGFAEMGIFDNDVEDVQFHTDVDVTFTGTGETDSGLTFGFNIDLDESIGDNNAINGGPESQATRDDSAQGGESIFISGSFGTITMGDTDGAYDAAMKEAIIGGSIADNHEHEGYNGNSGLDGTYDGQIVRYDYSFDAFKLSVSAEMDDTGAGDDVFGLGVSGSFGDIGFGVGYQDSGADEIVGVSVDASFGDIQVIANYSDRDSTGDHVGLAVGYSSGPLLVAANWGDYESGANGAGLVVNYDLGGGAEIQFGYGNNDVADTSTWSLGLAMSF